MQIGSADTALQVLVVAEVGNNHEGDVKVALELIRAAAQAGAGAVKFQAIDPARLARPTETTRIAQLERFRLAPKELAGLAEEAHSLGLDFICTPFDLDAVQWLTPLVDAFKISSGDNNFAALISAVAAPGKPVIVSSGMADIAQMRSAQAIIDDLGAPFAALHCVSAYPTMAEDAELTKIGALARDLKCTVGYSDHTIGNEACVLATAFGARIVEKHFTLSHDFSDFRDHQLSADPPELAELVERVALAEKLAGTGETPSSAELEAAHSARRSIVAARDLTAGTVIQFEDLEWLRPADGLAPGREGELVGKVLAIDRRSGSPIMIEDLGT
jgi:N,N'-diacetyllegionaminate synthase